MRWILVALLALLVACSQQNPGSQSFTLEQIGQLTPEQIDGLSDAQLQEIQRLLEPEFATAEASLAQLQSELNLSPQDLEAQDSRWPNFSYTVYVATGISYKTFFSSYYNKYSGPNWSNDGCSNSPDYPLGLNFKPSCNHHDFGYRNVSQYARGRNETYRKYVDSRFLSNLKIVCGDVSWLNPTLKAKCYALAYTYYTAVRNLGKSSYYKNPQRYP